jgi:hypothetical protein
LKPPDPQAPARTVAGDPACAGRLSSRAKALLSPGRTHHLVTPGEGLGLLPGVNTQLCLPGLTHNFVTPGEDPGSMPSLSIWIPHQVRDDYSVLGDYALQGDYAMQGDCAVQGDGASGKSLVSSWRWLCAKRIKLTDCSVG